MSTSPLECAVEIGTFYKVWVLKKKKKKRQQHYPQSSKGGKAQIVNQR